MRFLSLALGLSGALRPVDRYALEGSTEQPTFVTYFRREDHPGVLFAFEWPLRGDSDQTDEAVWFAHTCEVMGDRLPHEPGADGVVRFR